MTNGILETEDTLIGELSGSIELNGYLESRGPKGDTGPIGPVGPQGVGIESITKTATVGLVDTYTILYTDGTTTTYEVRNGSGGGGGVSSYRDLTDKPQINGVELNGDLSTEDLDIEIPTKLSDLENDEQFITNSVNNLLNYYLKTETYSQDEINTLIANVNSFNVQVVETLPIEDIDTHTIYLLPKVAEENDNYDEYIYISNGWEHIGSTDIDLTNYVQKEEGKGLSSNDYTTNDKNKLESLKGTFYTDGINETPTKIVIETNSLNTLGTEVVDTLEGNEHFKAPSVNAVNKLHNYSRSEQKIGTWIDGKPLYRKTFTFLTPEINISNWTTLVTGGEFLVDVTGTINGRPYNNVSIAGQGVYHLALDITVNAGNIQYRNLGLDSGQGVVITLMYTKTTD